MLEADALIQGAMQETGLSDFGGDSWREGLDVLLDALANEGELHEAGEMMLGVRLGRLLASRLRIEDWYA